MTYAVLTIFSSLLGADGKPLLCSLSLELIRDCFFMDGLKFSANHQISAGSLQPLLQQFGG